MPALGSLINWALRFNQYVPTTTLLHFSNAHHSSPWVTAVTQQTEALKQQLKPLGGSECSQWLLGQPWVFHAPEGASTSSSGTSPSVPGCWLDGYGRTQIQQKTFQLKKWSLFCLARCVTKTFWMARHARCHICISIWSDTEDTCQARVYIPDKVTYPSNLINPLPWN